MGLGMRGELDSRPEEYDVVFTFLPAHFHHIIEQLRFRQSSVGSIFLSAGEPGELAWHSWGLGVMICLTATLQKELETRGYKC